MENIEKKLIEQLKQGDEQSYKYIYDHYYAFLCYIADSYVKDHFTAETIVGDTVFHLWEIRDSLDITFSLRAYLSRAVRNRCLNYLASESEKHEVQLSDLVGGKMQEENILLSVDSPLDNLLNDELKDTINKSVERLPDECRTVFKKSRFEEKKHAEIAQELGISINTVKYHIKNALSALQADFEKYILVLLLYFLR